MKKITKLLLAVAVMSVSVCNVFAQNWKLELTPSLMKVTGITAPIGINDPDGDGQPNGKSYGFDHGYDISGELKVTKAGEKGDVNFTAFMYDTKTDTDKTSASGDQIWSLWINPWSNNDNAASTVNAETDLKVSIFDLDCDSDLVETSAWDIKLITGFRFASAKQSTKIDYIDNSTNWDTVKETSASTGFGPKVGLAVTSKRFEKIKIFSVVQVAFLAGNGDAGTRWTRSSGVTYKIDQEETFAVNAMPSFELGAKYPVGDSLSFGLSYKAAVWNDALHHIQPSDDTTANYSDKQYNLVMSGLKFGVAYQF